MCFYSRSKNTFWEEYRANRKRGIFRKLRTILVQTLYLQAMKLLVHACCGPCAIMPTRLLAAQGHDICVHYANSNIAPRTEYEHRLAELRKYADANGFDVIEGNYDPAVWEATVSPIGEAVERGELGVSREDRCRACYRMRLEESAAYAAVHGFEGLSTTLAVSPYQLRDVMHEELDRACAATGIAPVFEDFTPHYAEATRISRALGMYRQNYCGCRFSVTEAEQTRAQLRREKAERAAAREAERAAEREAHAAEKQAYAEKQARKRAILKQLRTER